jgi:hypothetical protein
MWWRVRFVFPLIGLLALTALPAGQALALTVVFTGNAATAGTGQGVIGHDFVAAGAIPHMAAFYSSHGVAGPYTALTTPDAYDFATGGEVAIGANLPLRQFGLTAPASPGLAALGINGSLHIGYRGFTLDVGSLVDLSVTGPDTEHRIYRNGEVKIFEETGPGVFAEIGGYINGVFEVDIDYSTGAITNVFTGDLTPGSSSLLPAFMTGTSFDPIDVAGTTPELYGGFSNTTVLELSETIAIAEPAPPLELVAVVLGFAACMRRRSGVQPTHVLGS